MRWVTMHGTSRIQHTIYCDSVKSVNIIIIERCWELSIDVHKKWMQTTVERGFSQSASLCIFIGVWLEQYLKWHAFFADATEPLSLKRTRASQRVTQQQRTNAFQFLMARTYQLTHTQTDSQRKRYSTVFASKLDRLCFELWTTWENKRQ